MKLKTYLHRERITLADFGRRIGRSHATVSRLCEGHQKPSLELAESIANETNGEVTAQDFLSASSASTKKEAA